MGKSRLSQQYPPISNCYALDSILSIQYLNLDYTLHSNHHFKRNILEVPIGFISLHNTLTKPQFMALLIYDREQLVLT